MVQTQTVVEDPVSRRRAWAYAMGVWVIGAALVIYIHVILPNYGWWVMASYMLYFLDFWYLLCLGELHRFFYSRLVRQRH